MAIERFEVRRQLQASAATVFAVLSDPQGHVRIDSTGMLQSAEGERVTAAGDSFVVHMDRESLNDLPMGRYDVTVIITAFEPDTAIEWTISGTIQPPIKHLYGYRLEPRDGGTLVTSYYDWSQIEERYRDRVNFPVIPESGATSHTGHPGPHRRAAAVLTPPIDFLAHLRAESGRFCEVMASVDPAARVPSCPDWDAADLLWHLSEVQNSWGVIVRERLQDIDDYAEPERPPDYPGMLAQFEACSSLLIDSLAATADDVPVWTWFAADQSVGFVRRRQAHEALIHRLDAELTASQVTAVDPALATDGVSEVLEWMFGGAPRWSEHTIDGPVGRVATTDTGSDWLIRIGRWSGHSPDTGKTYADEPSLTIVGQGEPTFTVSGTARDLDAWLWNRPTLTDIALDGDTATFEEVIRSGVQ